MTSTTTPITAASTTGATTGSTTGPGWLEDLLRHAGASPSTAHTLVEFVFKPLWIVLIIVAAVIVARLGAHAIRRILTRTAGRAADRSDSPRAAGRVATVTALVATGWRVFVFVVAVFLILGFLGVNLTPLLASATVIGATIGFGAQALVRDYLSGLLLTVEDQFGIGDTVAVNEVSGIVEDVTLRVTRIRDADGTVWFVPNGEIRKLANRSRGWAKAVVDLPVPLFQGLDLLGAKAAVSEAAASVAAQPRFAASCPDPPEMLGVVSVSSDSAAIRVALRTSPELRLPVERALREAAIARLTEDGLWPDAPAVQP